MTLDELGQRLRSAAMVAIDVETEGLDWRRHDVVGYALAFPDGAAVYLPVRHKQGVNLPPPPIEQGLARHLARPDLTVVGYNLAFDLKFLAKHGIAVRGPCHDPMIYAAMVDEHSPDFSLEAQAVRHGCSARKHVGIADHITASLDLSQKAAKKSMEHFHRLSAQDNHAHAYACADVLTTLELHDKLGAEIAKQKMGRVRKLEDDLIPVLHEMSWRGMRIDEAELHRVIAVAETSLAIAGCHLPVDLNTRSPLQMEAWFMAQGVTDWPLTENGRPSFPELWLGTNQPGRRILAHRKWRTLLDTFLYPMRDEHLFRGRVHTNINQLRRQEGGTVTGRLSSTSPNLFNMPSPKRQPEQGKLLRRIFIPDDGMEFAEADFNQVEPRLFAQYAKAESWVKGYMAEPPMDAHAMVAAMANLTRTQGKTINMGLLYGMGQNELVRRLGVSPEKGLILLQRYHDEVPEVRAFTRFSERMWRRHRFLTSVLGRRFHLRDDNEAFMAANRIIQGSCADLIKLTLVKCAARQAAAGCELLNSVYDSIVWQGGHHAAMKEAMLDTPEIPFKVPMVVDLKAGKRWSDCSD